MGREALCRAVSANSLEWDENTEKPVDRVTALGLATKGNALGSALIHAEALDMASARQAVLLVARHIIRTHRIARTYAEHLAATALHEYLHPCCRTCGGMPYASARSATICPSCAGTGLHRYSDTERGHGQKYHRQAYESALALIREKLATAVHGARARLE